MHEINRGHCLFGEEEGVVCGVGQKRLGPFYFFISLASDGASNQPLMVRTFLKVFGARLLFLLLQEQIKDIIIIPHL